MQEIGARIESKLPLMYTITGDGTPGALDGGGILGMAPIGVGDGTLGMVQTGAGVGTLGMAQAGVGVGITQVGTTRIGAIMEVNTLFIKAVDKAVGGVFQLMAAPLVAGKTRLDLLLPSDVKTHLLGL